MKWNYGDRFEYGNSAFNWAAPNLDGNVLSFPFPASLRHLGPHIEQ